MLKVKATGVTSKEYAEDSLRDLRSDLFWLKFSYALINVITAIIAMAISILTALIISKLVWSSFPSWYFFVTTGLTAFSLLIAQMANFFVVKDSISKKKKVIALTELELFAYDKEVFTARSAGEREYNLYLRVAAGQDNEAAEAEVKHG